MFVSTAGLLFSPDFLLWVLKEDLSCFSTYCVFILVSKDCSEVQRAQGGAWREEPGLPWLEGKYLIPTLVKLELSILPGN